MKYGFLENVDAVDFKLPPEHIHTKSILESLQKTSIPKVYIGGPVFSDKSFKGTLYPSKTPQSKFLAEYAKQFNSIEVNSTRYGMIKIDTLKRWAAMVDDRFRFSFKLPQVISHRKSIIDNDAMHRMDQFIVALSEIYDKVGTTYMLMPSYFKMDRFGELEQFVKSIPLDLRFSIEFRNAEIQNHSEIIALLTENNISMTITDTAGQRDTVHKILTNDELFIRFLGNRLHKSDYERIEEWGIQISEWINRGLKQVYFFIHQPSPQKYLCGPLAAYLVEKLKEFGIQSSMIKPTDFSSQ